MENNQKKTKKEQKNSDDTKKTDCTVSNVLDFAGKRWTLLILLEIYKREHGKARYSDIKKSIPDITPKILSLRLKELEETGLLKKTIDSSSFPIKCEYSLTESGQDFVKIIKQMKSWGLTWLPKRKVCSEENCKNCAFNR